ncbi:MAG: ATP-binding cassette domain-containing protein [Cypionkella sp.]
MVSAVPRSRACVALILGHLLDEPNPAVRKTLILDVFAQVGLDNPQRDFDSYPHQLSGGMLQRVLIGLAVLPRPALLVADEPTSALDVTIQKRILDLLSRLQADLGIADERTDALIVLKGGVVQKTGDTAAVFAAPSTVNARKLYADVPALNPDSCAALRDPVFKRLAEGAAPKIEIFGVTKTFSVDGRTLIAGDNVSFAVPTGTTHGLVDESGSGKTTAIRLLMGLDQTNRCSMTVAGLMLSDRTPETLHEAWRHLQLVYQNPFTSLDPTWKVETLVREPLDPFASARRLSAMIACVRRWRVLGWPNTCYHASPALCPAASGSA